MITTVSLKNFTVFEDLKMKCAPGVNIFIGENGTGKTHLLKVLYTGCKFSTIEEVKEQLLFEHIFATTKSELLRINSSNTRIKINRTSNKKNLIFEYNFSNPIPKDSTLCTSEICYPYWKKEPINSAYIPVKEILSNAPGFRSLYSNREVAFEKVYYDIIDQAFLPPLRNGDALTSVLKKLEQALGGHIEQEGERFFLKTKSGRFDFMLVAEGLKKLGLLWLLIKNGSIKKGSVLCWDEPDANLNPKLLKIVASILLELQEMGVQIFLSTHNYVLLKEFDLQTKKNHSVRFHAFYRDTGSGSVKLESTDEYDLIAKNAIVDTFLDLYDREINQTIIPEEKK